MTEIGLESQVPIGFDRVHALVLKFVSADFVGESDAAAFVPPHVDEDAVSALGDLSQRGLKLGPTIASERVQSVSGQAFGMHAHQDGILELACAGSRNKRQMLCSVDSTPKGVKLELAFCC